MLIFLIHEQKLINIGAFADAKKHSLELCHSTHTAILT